MKKSTLLKMALTLTAMFMFTGAFAQILTDYSEDETVDMYQTAGRTFRLYTLPDPVYSPTYDAVNNANLGANSQWRFVYAGLTGTPATNTLAAQNWVEFTNPAKGDYTVEVTEYNTSIGCEDGTARTTTIHVVDAPVATTETADNTTFCGDQGAQSIVLKITEYVPNTVASYAFSVEEEVQEIDGASAPIGAPVVNAAFVDFSIAAGSKANFGDEIAGSTPNFTYTFSTSALTVKNLHRTRYTYTFHDASDAGTAADGIISAISHKSDYIQGLTSYAFTDNQVVFIVNPAPVTGPVYHIPNAFRY